MYFYRTLSASSLLGIPIAVVLVLSACDTQTSSQGQLETDIQRPVQSNIVTEEESKSDVMEPAPLDTI